MERNNFEVRRFGVVEITRTHTRKKGVRLMNSDSIKEYIRRYEKYIPKVYELPPMPDLPIKKGYETPYY